MTLSHLLYQGYMRSRILGTSAKLQKAAEAQAVVVMVSHTMHKSHTTPNENNRKLGISCNYPEKE